MKKFILFFLAILPSICFANQISQPIGPLKSRVTTLESDVSILEIATSTLKSRVDNLDLSTKSITEGNATAYININSNPQIKSGALTVSSFTSNGQGLFKTSDTSISQLTIENGYTDSDVLYGGTIQLKNGLGYSSIIGMTGSDTTFLGGAFNNTFQNWQDGYGDSLFSIGGNKYFRWYADPTDSHTYATAMANQIMALSPTSLLEVSSITAYQFNVENTTSTNIYSTTGTFKDIIIPTMTCSRQFTVNDWFKNTVSAGRLTGGTITDNGDRTVTVAEGTGFVRVADDDVSQVKYIHWESSANIPVPLNTARYLGVGYNVNCGTVQVKTTATWDLDTNFPLGSVLNISSSLYVQNNPWWVGDGLTNVIERFQAEGFNKRDEYIGGLILGVTGTRNPTLTAGTVWSRLNEFDITAKDCSSGDSFYMFYRDGGTGWVRTSTFSAYPVTSYDNNSGSTVALNNNYYANFWVFIEIGASTGDGQLMLIFPQNQYATAAAAEAESVPVFPTTWYEHGILVGRILFKQNTDTPIQVQSVFSTVFNAAQAADHGNLSGLTDDDHTQYLLRTDYAVFKSTAESKLDALRVDTTTLKTRIDNLDTSTASLTTRIVGHDLFRSTASIMISYSSSQANSFDLFVDTAETKIAGLIVFKSTSEQKIDSFNLFKSSFETTSASISSLTVRGTVTSTSGFVGGGSTFTTVNSNYFIGNGSLLTNLPSSGGGISTTTYYASYLIGAYLHTNASSQTVNCSSNTQYCFAQGIAALNSKGSIVARQGNYNFLSELQVPNGIDIWFEKGSSVTVPTTTSKMISSSGTLRGLTFCLPSAWAGTYALRLGDYGKCIDCEMLPTRYTATNHVNHPIRLSGKNSTLSNFRSIGSFDNTGVGSGGLIYIGDNTADCIGAVMENSYIEHSDNNDIVLFGLSTGAVVRNNTFRQSAMTYAMWLGNPATKFLPYNATISGNSFIANSQAAGVTGMIRYQASSGTIITNNLFYIKNANTGTGLFGYQGTYSTTISNNTFYGLALGIYLYDTGSVDNYIHGNNLMRCTAGITDNGANTQDRDNLLNGSFIAE